MVTRLFNLDATPDPPDVADALALAVCHLWAAPVHASLGARAPGAGATPAVQPGQEVPATRMQAAVDAALARDARAARARRNSGAAR